MANDTLPTPGFFEKHRAKIEFGAPGGCWLWTACTNVNGYGAVRARGKSRKAHREAYEAENGPGSAEGLVVRHRCDTPPCVNPDHLLIGTVANNVMDMDERGRRVTPKGEARGRAKLTDDDIRTIRAALVPGCPINGTRALARRFGVSHSVISRIIHRKIWSHVS